MKNIRYILILSIFFLFSCSQDKLDEIDTDPNNPVNVPSEFIIPDAEIKMVNSFYASGSATAISTYVEHTCNVHAEKMELNRKTGIWDVGYKILKDTQSIIEQSTKEEAWTHVGIAQVIQAFTLGTMTDIFGDIPWTEALQGSNNRNPKYDTQQFIYDELFQMLDDAISNLSMSVLTNPGKNDILLAGINDKWIKVAWGLKARYKNRLSNIDPAGSASDALTAVNNSFKSSAEDFIFKNYQNATTYANAISYEENQMSRFSASITIFKVIDSFNDPGFEDPRANKWFDKINGKFIGAPNGENVQDLAKVIYSGVSRKNVLYLAAPMPLLTYDELKFIEAEA
ncbi:MAG: SusD/RagB family nutrient-binding outer membrane lipoprotein, partial [Bacteroidetes bacterium]